MPLLDNGNPTIEEKQDQTKRRMVNTMRSLWQTMKQSYEMLFTSLWYNQSGLTPQQVLDAFGGDAVEFFGLGLAMYNFMNAVQPGVLDLPAPFPIVPNANGTITVILDRSSSSSVSSESSATSDSSVSSGPPPSESSLSESGSSDGVSGV